MKIVTSYLHNGVLYVNNINGVILDDPVGGYVILPSSDTREFTITKTDEWVEFPEIPQWLEKLEYSDDENNKWLFTKLIEAALMKHHMLVDYDRYSELLLSDAIETYVNYLVSGPPAIEDDATESNDSNR